MIRQFLHVIRASLFLLLAFSVLNTNARKSRSNDLLSGEEKIAVLQSRVRDGVVTLASADYQKFILRPDRPYHFILLFTAMGAKYNCDVCMQVAPEFHTVGESYMSAKQTKLETRDGLEVFYGVVDFDSNSDIYGVYQFTSAPQILYVGPDRSSDTGGAVPSKVEAPQHDIYNVYSNGKSAESIAGFVKQKTGFEVEIQRSKAFLYALLASIAVTLLVVTKVVISNFEKVLAKFRRKRLWMAVSLLFYGLSVSGMVYCIIREPPPYAMDRNGNVMYFHHDGRSQFVVEGLFIGGLDIFAAVFVILLSQWAIYIRRPTLRIPAIVICAFGFLVSYKVMVACYTYKNRWYQGWMGL